MKITNSMSAQAVKTEIGKRIARYRIDSALSQKELADKAGIGVGTLIRLEDGQNSSTETLLRVLWALSLQENLEVLLPDADWQPVDILRWNRKSPQRASRKRHKNQMACSSES